MNEQLSKNDQVKKKNSSDTYSDNGADVTVSVKVMNDNNEVSCVAKATKMWYFDAVLFAIFMKIYRVFCTLLTGMFYGPYPQRGRKYFTAMTGLIPTIKYSTQLEFFKN
jgi:hypothetical protein